MTVEIICGDISALPSSDHATELLPLTDGDTLTLSCTDSDLKAAYRVLRAIWTTAMSTHSRRACV